MTPIIPTLGIKQIPTANKKQKPAPGSTDNNPIAVSKSFNATPTSAPHFNPARA